MATKPHIFTGDTLKILRSGGWFEGRSVDTAAWENLLRKEGHPVHAAVIAFLREFGGLVFENPNPVRQASTDWGFRVEKAVASAVRMKYYSERARRPLCVIGESDRGYLQLMMDETGQVYGGFDEEFFYLGKSGRHAIDALRSGRPVKRVPEL
jgi:hypothetical protein